MIISCSSCTTRYVVQPINIGENGRTVKCVKCNYCWIIPGNSEKQFKVDDKNNGTHPSSTSPIYDLVKNTEDTRNLGSTQGILKIERPRNLVSHCGAHGPANLKKAAQTDGISTPKIQNLTTQSKPTILDKKSNRWTSVTVYLVLCLLLIGTIGGAVKYREWVTTTWPPTAEMYRVLGINVLPQKAKLTIRNVNYKYLTSNTLKIHGELVSVSKTPHDTPVLKVVFLDGNGIVVLNRKLLLSKKVVEAKETLKFSTEIRNPPTKAKRIEVDVVK